MELVWHRGYEDYEDSAWTARKNYLTGIWQNLSAEKAAGMETVPLMDGLESIEELMRYYASVKDFENLEPLMRSYEPLLELLRHRNPDNTGYWYLEMEYSRLNALLYLNQGSNQQAIQYYSQALHFGENCFSRLQSEEAFYDGEQRLYLAWSCAECRNEMAVACERILDTPGMYQVLTASLPLLQYAEEYLGDADGICEKIADFYARIGAIFYQYNNYADGNQCYEKARNLFDRLADKLSFDFYRARALWIQSLHGIDAFLRTGNTDIMLNCERGVTQFLESGVSGHGRAVAEGALAMTCMQRGNAIQQAGGDIKEAIRWTEKSVNLFGNAHEALEKECQNLESSTAKGILSDIAARLYNTGITAMEVLGVQYYAAGQGDEAQSLFEQVLAMLTDTNGFHVAESASLVLRAESCHYLALLAADADDRYKADFYGTQAMNCGEEAAQKTGNPAAWQIVIISASLVSEIAAITKEKLKMSTAAARGLAACDELARLMPEHGILSMRSNLEKRIKKSSKRFFGF